MREGREHRSQGEGKASGYVVDTYVALRFIGGWTTVCGVVEQSVAVDLA